MTKSASFFLETVHKLSQAILLVGITFFIVVSTQSFAAGQRASTEAYLAQLHSQGKERVIVRFKDKIDRGVLSNYNARVIRKLKIINALVCEIDQADISSLKQQPNVKDVIPDAIIRIPRPQELPADPDGKLEEKAGEPIPKSYDGSVTVRWNNLAAGLNSQSAWDNYTLDGTGVKVAILDTGIQYDLPDLINNYLGGWDFVDNDNEPLPPNTNEYHGTEVASLAIGEGASEIIGVAYKANYYAVRVMQGEEDSGLVSDAIAGVQWAIDPDGLPETDDGADVINMSFRAYTSGLDKDNLEAACNAAYAQGIVLVAASANDGYSYSGWPASFDNVISVGAHTESQSLWDDTFGKSNGGVDVVAPGAASLIIATGPTWIKAEQLIYLIYLS